MQLELLREEIETDPLGLGYAAHGKNALGAVLAIMRSTPRSVHRSLLLSSRGLKERWPQGHRAAEEFLQKLELFSMSQNPDAASARRELAWFANAEGLDVGSSAIRELVSELAAAGVVTPLERDAFMSLSIVSGNRIEELTGAPDVDDGAVTALFFNDDGSEK